MRLLLDTHALLWWLYGSDKLSDVARDTIADENNKVYVSAASAWEIATKFRIGKLPHAREAAENLPYIVQAQEFDNLPMQPQRRSSSIGMACSIGSRTG